MQSAIRALAIAGAMASICPSFVQAQTKAGVPDSGFYAGAGVNGNLVVPTSQTIFMQGVSNIYQGGALAAFGSAGGPTNPRPRTAATISPSAQLGYFQRLSKSRWLLGGKFTYNYMAATATDHFVAVPQSGSYILVPGTAITSFTGNVVVRSYQITADHQFSLVPYAGYAFDRSYIYLGAGPSLTHTEVKLNDAVGYANINGAAGTNITGPPANYSSSQWLIGATLTAGATYFLTPEWFLDIGYTFTITDLWNSTFSSPFGHTGSAFGATYQTVGVLSGSYTGGLNTHTLTVSINRRF